MSHFDYLLIGHLVGDFLFQTSWMAQYKSTRWIPLFTHVAVYTTIVFLISLLFGGLSVFGIVTIFIGHVILDRKGFVTFWVRRIQTVPPKSPSEGWLTIVADQIFHIILLAIAISI